MKFWGIHAGQTGDAESLFAEGWVAIGWHELGDLTQIEPNRDAFKEKYADAYPHSKPGAIPTSAGQWFRFIYELDIDDLVVFRPKHMQEIRIGKIVGPYEYSPTTSEGYPHLRRTEWLTTVSTNTVTQGARYELGSAMSLFRLRNYADEWKSLLDGETESGEEEGEDPTVAIVAEDIEQLTEDFVLKKLSTVLKGHGLEYFVAHLLHLIGYQTRVSPEGTDGGIDILAHKDLLGFESPIVKVQVKSSDRKSGHPEVSSLIGSLAGEESGLFVSLGGFTQQAKNLARNRHKLRLIDAADLVEIILNNYEELDARHKSIIPLKKVYVAVDD